MTSIGASAFGLGFSDDSRDLTDVYCYAENLPKIEYGEIFNGRSINIATLHVPEKSIEAYKAVEPWNMFGKIVALNEKGDASGNGFMDAEDILAILNYIMGKPSDMFDKDAADANGDGIVNIADIVLIVKNIIGN